MKSHAPQFLDGGRRFPLDPYRILLLALGVALLWGLGLAAGGWSATLSLEAARAGRSIPWAPWLAACALVVSGMLAVVYGFFFRPRAVEIGEEEVALIMWDGKGKSRRRGEVKRVEVRGSRIVLRGEGGDMAIPGIFLDTDELAGMLRLWV